MTTLLKRVNRIFALVTYAAAEDLSAHRKPCELNLIYLGKLGFLLPLLVQAGE